MTGASQSQVAAQLQVQLDKIRAADPFRTLDVPVQVDGEGVRRAYLSLTKRFHPNRFALEPAPTRDIANEVFLLIRRAYDLLVDDDKRKLWRERVAPTGKLPQTAPPAPPTPSPMATPARVPTVAPAGAPASTLRPSTAVGTPAPGASGASKRPTVPTMPTVPTVPAGARAPLPAGARPPGTNPPRSGTVPGVPPAGANPMRGRPSPATGIGASPQEVQAMLDAARTRGQRFDDAVAMLGRGKYREAREAFYKIAMEDPQSKRYRVQLHYAWGLEHLADGKLPEGQRELERALALEPESADIKAALTKAQEQQKKPGGILGKLFGR